MRWIVWFFVFSSGFVFANNLECVVNHSGRGISRFEITGTGAYVVNTPYKSRVVVGARLWTHDECSTKTCYALLVGLVKNQAAATSFVNAWQNAAGTWADVERRVGSHTTVFAATLPIPFQRRQSIGYGYTLTVHRNNSSYFGGGAYEEASLSCRLK